MDAQGGLILGLQPRLPGFYRGPVCSLGCLKPSVPTVSRFAIRATFASRVRLRTQFVVGVGTGRTLTGAGRRLKAHAPHLKIVSIVPEILPGIEGLTPLGCPEDIVPAILGVAGRIVARAAYDALVLRGTIGHGLRLLVDDALRGGVHARRPRPVLEPEARRLVALDRDDLRRLAESAIGQPVHGLLHVLHRGIVGLLDDDEAPLLLGDLPLLGRGGATFEAERFTLSPTALRTATSTCSPGSWSNPAIGMASSLSRSWPPRAIFAR